MRRAFLLALTLLALALPSTAVAAEPLWPLDRTPFTLTPEACAADAECTSYVEKRDAALAGETAEQRAAREARLLGFRPSPKAARTVAASAKEMFDPSAFRRTPALQRKMRKALSLGALQAALGRELALRGWNRRDLGDLFAIQFVSSWRMSHPSAQTDTASEAAFREGLRDLLARDRRVRRSTAAERQVTGEVMALMAIGFHRMVAAMPAEARPQVRRAAVRGLRDIAEEQFGVDPSRLRQVPSGFAPQR